MNDLLNFGCFNPVVATACTAHNVVNALDHHTLAKNCAKQVEFRMVFASALTDAWFEVIE
jgi:hypothetical protein